LFESITADLEVESITAVLEAESITAVLEARCGGVSDLVIPELGFGLT
jgi:hypothetical protein